MECCCEQNCIALKKEIEKLKLADLSLIKLSDYLYSVKYYDWDYSVGHKYVKRYSSIPIQCSAVRKSNLYGRNFDWFYNKSVEYIVQTAPTRGRHASLSVCQGHPDLIEPYVKNGNWMDAYDVLPFLAVDGINDAGVVCNVNVVPTGDKPRTTGTNPGKERFNGLMLVRYILDYANSASHAIDLLKNIDIWMPENGVLDTELHYMIADSTVTYIVEFVNNHLLVFSDAEDDYDDISNEMPIMTNFYIAGWDGNIVTGFDTESGIMPYETTLTPHAEGLERYRIIADAYDDISSIEDLKALMESVKFTNAYDSEKNPFWYSEFVGDNRPSSYGDLTIYQPKAVLQPFVDASIREYEHRERNGKTWHTMHTSLFDISSHSITVYSQEDYEHPFIFTL